MGWILEWANSALAWAWVAAVLVSPPVPPCLHHQGEFSSTGLASSPLAEMRWHQLSGFQVHRICSPTPTPSGPALPCTELFVKWTFLKKFRDIKQNHQHPPISHVITNPYGSLSRGIPLNYREDGVQILLMM